MLVCRIMAVGDMPFDEAGEYRIRPEAWWTEGISRSNEPDVYYLISMTP
jgi:hypothetical protein